MWFDADGRLEHGDEWDGKIRRQIKECVLFIPIISADTQARHEGYFRVEWELAAERAMGIASGVAFILPIVIDGTREPDALVPDRFRKVQWTKLPGGVVPPEVQARFLKLWSHRTGVLAHEAARSTDPSPSLVSRPGFHAERGLAAVVFTDVVGYSARMQRDETGTMALVKADFAVMSERCAQHGGEVLNTMGDGLLMCFSSAVQAVTCALQVQSEFGRRRAALPPEQALEHRMGIHIGDVFRQETGGLAGDGVNIAARLEGKAPAGGVCVSQMVYDTVKGKVAMQSVFIGPESFKNITEPIPIWHVAAEDAPAPTRPPMPIAAKRPRQAILLAVAAAIVALAVGGYFWVNRSALPAAPAMSAAQDPPGTAAKVGERSVAVLPFTNQSADRENEYFSDGIAEELLTTLQKIPGLRVAARTSAWSFKGKNPTAREVGEKLHVAHLVDGSVQKIGNRVKITAHLNRAATGEEQWGDTFGPLELTDVFATQTEIAQKIVTELRGRLTGEATPAMKAEIQVQVQAAQKGGTKNPEAHRLYLQGKFLANQASAENLEKAAGYFQQAVDTDRSFALAWAALARALAVLATTIDNTPAVLAETFERARSAADRALALEPALAEAHLAKMEIQVGWDLDWLGANESVRRALAEAPADAMAVSDAGRLAKAFGKFEKAVELGRRAVELDPVNAELHYTLGSTYVALGRFTQAEAEERRAQELSPATLTTHRVLSLALMLDGRLDQAMAEAELETNEWGRQTALALTYWALKKPAESEKALARLIEIAGDTCAYQVAEIHAFRGEPDAAFQWLDRAQQTRDGGLLNLRIDPLFKSIRTDPRWPAFLKKIGLSDEQVK